MQFQDTLHPYELLPLLESLRRETFTGTVTLHADEGRTQLYLDGGVVRYATTTEVGGSLPAYLITEELFPRDRIHRWLEECTDEERTLEALLLERHRVDPRGLVHLKEDLARLVFARAFHLTAAVDLEPTPGDAPDFGDLVLAPYEALFECCAEHPEYGAIFDALQGRWEVPLRRARAFFVQFPTFRRFFPGSVVPGLIDTSPTLAGLLQDSDAPEETVAQVFAMRLAGMVFLQGEEPRPVVLRPEVRPPLTASPAPRPPASAPPGRPTTAPGGHRRPITRPGLPVATSEAETGSEAGPSETGPAGQTEGPAWVSRTAHTVISPPPPVEADDAERRAARFPDLRGGLVGEGLIEAARQAERMTGYEFLGVPPTAPLSRIRAAWQRIASRYREENFHGHHLPGEAGAALRRLQDRCQEAYDTLTDLRRRREHDALHRVEEGLSRDELDAMFYAEGVFKAAQIRMAREQWLEAMELLREAIGRAPDEPEYRSYLAWAAYGALVSEQESRRRLPKPDALLDEALDLDPKLESAWLFRARMADHAGEADEACSAYYQVLNANPDNAEARDAVERFREEGLEPEISARPKLAERIARLLRGRPSGS
ncbi:MAG: J domain-containing protein [Myxococcota bacterium]